MLDQILRKEALEKGCIHLKFASIAIPSYEQNNIQNQIFTDVGSNWLRQLFGRFFCTSYDVKNINGMTYL